MFDARLRCVSATPLGSDVDPDANDLTAFTLPVGNESLPVVAVLLLKNVDLGVQKGMTAEQIVEQILEPFAEKAPTVVQMAAGLDEANLMAMIQENTSTSWALMSPRGEQIVLQVFALWNDDGDDEEGAT